MKKRLVLIGAGGHCKSVLNTVSRLKQYNEVVIIDKEYPKITEILGFPVVGTDDVLMRLKNIGFDEAFVAVGGIKSMLLRKRIYQNVKNKGFVFPHICDLSAQISDYSWLNEGVFIGQGAIINADVSIGKMAIINTGAIIEHECNIGEYAHISVGAKLCGNVSVGNHSFIGAGATVIQGISIGDNSIIGAGSTVVENIGDNQVVKGLVK